MSKQEKIDKVQALIKDVQYAMMTTITPEGHLHSCPMSTAEASLGAKEVWFLGDKTAELTKNIQNNPQVNLAYATQDDKNYVSINGKAELVDDQDKLDELWSPMYAAWYEQGKSDPDLQLIKIVPHGAEYWITGNGVVNFAKMAAAAMQDGETAEDIGETESITFD